MWIVLYNCCRRGVSARQSRWTKDPILLGWRFRRAFAVLVFVVVFCGQNYWLFRQVIVVVVLGVVVVVVVVFSEACRKAQVVILTVVPVKIIVVDEIVGEMASTVGPFAVEFAFRAPFAFLALRFSFRS